MFNFWYGPKVRVKHCRCLGADRPSSYQQFFSGSKTVSKLEHRLIFGVSKKCSNHLTVFTSSMVKTCKIQKIRSEQYITSRTGLDHGLSGMRDTCIAYSDLSNS